MPEQLQLTVEKLVYGGHGLSRDEGRVILTPLVLPGERIVVERVDKLHARLVRVEQPARERIGGKCPFFTTCGGCQYQHMPYEFQRAQKLEILREVMRRVGKFDAPGEIRMISGEPWEYRNRVQLHVRDGQIGYLRMGSHQLCPVDHCPISSPHLNVSIRALNGLVRDRRFPDFVRRIELFTNEENLQFNVVETERPLAKHFFEWIREWLPGYAPGAIEYAAAGERFRIGPRSFFQVNRFLVDSLVEEALQGASGGAALDLYAGAGLFSIPLARRFSDVTGVESGASAVADLQFNAERAGVRVRAVRTSVDEYLAGLTAAPEFVLADPPREGLGKKSVRELIRLQPSRIHIVSCDPATLARDLRQLLDAGYELGRMTFIDLFPQTYHLETIVQLIRR